MTVTYDELTKKYRKITLKDVRAYTEFIICRDYRSHANVIDDEVGVYGRMVFDLDPIRENHVHYHDKATGRTFRALLNEVLADGVSDDVLFRVKIDGQ